MRLGAVLAAGLALQAAAPAFAQDGAATAISRDEMNAAMPDDLPPAEAGGQAVGQSAPVPGRPVTAFAAQPQDALPSGDGVNPRAPGLQLTPDAASNADDPFAPKQEQTKSPEQVEAEIRTRAYDAAATGLLPMRPGEIRKLLETYDKTQQAVEVPVYPYPEPENTVQTISLDPGVKPSEVKVATGHVTTMTFMDMTGAPWPVQDISWAGNFEIVQPENGGSVLRVTPMSEFAYGNMSIRLVGLNTPVTFVLKTHRDVVQYRFDARIPQYGPSAKPPVIQGGAALLAAGDPVMGSILDGSVPGNAERLDVDGVDGRTTAYKLEQTTYVRTPLTLLSPGWTGSVSSADGMNVYQLRNAPVLLLSDEGQVVRARLSERDGSK